MKTIICRQCGNKTEQLTHGTSFFCNQICYFEWKKSNPNKKAYKGRVFISGYYYLYMPSHPRAIKGGRYIAEHRYVLEQKIGRLLEKHEISHHKNGDKKDNRKANLELLTNSEHSKHHAETRKRKTDGSF